MLTGTLLHPEILSALGRAGHGARVLIADGNFPCSTETPATAAKVFLNLRRGMVTVTEVLKVLAGSIPIESALVMTPPDGTVQPIHGEFEGILPKDITISGKTRTEFYSETKSPATALVIATGEERRFANILITIGVIKPEAK